MCIVGLSAASSCATTTSSPSKHPQTAAVNTTTRPTPGARSTAVRSTAPAPTVASHIVSIVVVYHDATRSTPARGATAAHAGRDLRTVVRWRTPIGDHPLRDVRPLVIFAPGFATSLASYATMLNDLAARDIIVAAPVFPGEGADIAGAPVQTDLNQEPCDIEFLARAMRSLPPSGLSRQTLSGPLFFAGHSDGATAALDATGNRPCNGPAAVAVIALSVRWVPWRVLGNPPASLFALTGDHDTVNPSERTTSAWRNAPGPAWLATVIGASHEAIAFDGPYRAAIDELLESFVLNAATPNSARSLIGSHDIVIRRRN